MRRFVRWCFSPLLVVTLLASCGMNPCMAATTPGNLPQLRNAKIPAMRGAKVPRMRGAKIPRLRGAKIPALSSFMPQTIKKVAVTRTVAGGVIR